MSGERPRGDVQTGAREVDEPALASRGDPWLLAFVGEVDGERKLRLGTLAPQRL